MRPIFSQNNSANSFWMHPLCLGKAIVRVSALGKYLSDLSNFRIREFCSGVFFANIRVVGSMFAAVRLIINMSIPTKIGKKTVGANAIIMAGFHSLRTKAAKGFQNESMNQCPIGATITVHRDMQVAMNKARLKDDLWRIAQDHLTAHTDAQRYSFPEGPNPPLATYFIAGKFRDWFPNFLINAILIISHGRNLLGFGLWSEPYRHSHAGAACFL